jgi:hypothetical protein
MCKPPEKSDDSKKSDGAKEMDGEKELVEEKSDDTNDTKDSD